MNRMKLVAAGLTSVMVVGVLAGHTQAFSSFAKWGSPSVVFYINPTNGDVDSTAAETAVQAGMTAWNTEGSSAFRYLYGGRVNDTSTGYDNRNVVIFRNASSGSALATTYSWWSGTTLLDSDIIFWDGAYAFYTGTGGCSSGAYIEDVATHELGHSLGLSHSGDAAATMYPSYSFCSQDMRTLAADDVAAVQSLYGNSAPSNTAPSVTISSPTATSFPYGVSISFVGSATDAQDGNLTASLVWTSNISGQIGSGGSVTTTLPSGAHVISARVTDRGGLTTTRQVTVTVGSVNNAPAVDVLSPSSTSLLAGTMISFSGAASDSEDGDLTPRIVWSSNLIGQLGTGGSFAMTLPAGTHVITAKVTDNGGLTSSRQVTLVVTAPQAPPAPGTPTLAASGYKVKGLQRADLSWTGVTGSVDVFRNGTRIATVPGVAWTDPINNKGGGSYRYKVCQAGSTTCSSEAIVTF